MMNTSLTSSNRQDSEKHLISCGARLAPFDIKELRDLTSYDELGLDMLGDEKTALFVIISDTDDTLLSSELDAPAPCRLNAPDLDFACRTSADCLHQHQQVI